ncbi:MAG TPA: glycosyltransferase family 2 protein [Candidatus Binatia bacterium]|nr:glycosyltransferase family 2 protein [Candidatus Binatia bacterium]
MSPEPFVTVIVPVRNEIRTIDRCLAALVDQDYPQSRIEILVVDGASDDGTPEAVRQRAAAAPHIRLLENPDGRAAAGMNLGIAAARGEVVARVDGHAIVPPDFVSRTVDALVRRPDVACVSGALVTLGRTATGRAIAAAMSSIAGVGWARFRTGARRERLVDTVAFPVYRRATLERLGKLDEELVRNQDDELNLRLTRAGGRILLLPDLRIVYFCQSTLRGLWRQYFQYGFWKVRVIQKHGAPASWRHLVPGALVAALAVLLPLALVPALRPLALGAVGAYAAAVVAASVALGATHGVLLVPRIAAAIATLHVAYGCGFWKGLATFGVPRPGRAEVLPVSLAEDHGR